MILDLLFFALIAIALSPVAIGIIQIVRENPFR